MGRVYVPSLSPTAEGPVIHSWSVRSKSNLGKVHASQFKSNIHLKG
uniref:Uncharacterized protein n=1 Tax=Rhizophora mucronata TaxID=61149 RepID=A0A2P2N5A7_RHIMU